MPHDADLSILRYIASTLLPTAKEAIVDDEMFFLYGSFGDFDIEAWMELTNFQRQDIGKTMRQYMSALCAFLSVYKCSFFRDWEAAAGGSLATEDGGSCKGQQT